MFSESNSPRVTLFCGHYGSGKTNIAVNYAFFLKERGFDTALADIDIVNPYFRSKDSENELKEKGVKVVSLPFANSSVDLPSLPSEVYGLVQRRDIHAVLDIGGDERGALALGRFAPYIEDENNYDMLFVVNFYRPLTPDAESAMEVMREIENACPLKFTGIVNNSNLGEITSPEDMLSALSGVPVKFTSVNETLKNRVDGESLFYLKLQKKLF